MWPNGSRRITERSASRTYSQWGTECPSVGDKKDLALCPFMHDQTDDEARSFAQNLEEEGKATPRLRTCYKYVTLD